MSDDIRIIKAAIKGWKDHRTEFYSGRIVLYHILDVMGYDAERIHNVDINMFESSDIITLSRYLLVKG